MVTGPKRNLCEVCPSEFPMQGNSVQNIYEGRQLESTGCPREEKNLRCQGEVRRQGTGWPNLKDSRTGQGDRKAGPPLVQGPGGWSL